MPKTENVSYGKPRVGGAIWSAPLGTKLPTNAIDPLDPSFKDLGYVSEDGLTNANTPESEVIKAWGGDSVLVIQSDKTDTFSYKLIEITNVDTLKEVYGPENVSGSLETSISIKANNKALPPHIIIIDMVLQGALMRHVIPNAKISEIGDVEYVDDDAAGFELTVTAMADDNGDTHLTYIQKESEVGV